MLQHLLLPIKQIRGEAVHILALQVLDEFMDESTVRSMTLADEETKEAFCEVTKLHEDLSSSLGGPMDYMAYNFYTHLLARYNDRNRAEIKKGKWDDIPVFFVAHLLNRYSFEMGQYVPKHKYTVESLDNIIALFRELCNNKETLRSSFKVAMQIATLAKDGKIQHKGKK